LFEEIVFDLRLETFAQRERAAVVKSLGFKRNLRDSNLYERPM